MLFTITPHRNRSFSADYLILETCGSRSFSILGKTTLSRMISHSLKVMNLDESKYKVIGVTGTNGKTTTKDFICKILDNPQNEEMLTWMCLKFSPPTYTNMVYLNIRIQKEKHMERLWMRSNSNNDSVSTHIPNPASQAKNHILSDYFYKLNFDVTMGTGGHAEIMPSELPSSVMLFDKDEDKRIINLSKNGFTEFKDGFIQNLGICITQLDNPKRSFSYDSFDMRMDQNQKLTTDYVINNCPAKDLTKNFRESIEIRFCSQIVEVFLHREEKEKSTNTYQLRKIIDSNVAPRNGIKSLCRIFQTIIIELSRELEVLKKRLDFAANYLSLSGKLCYISYHSLEDRIVNREFVKRSKDCVCSLYTPGCDNKVKTTLEGIKREDLTDRIIKSPQTRTNRELKSKSLTNLFRLLKFFEFSVINRGLEGKTNIKSVICKHFFTSQINSVLENQYNAYHERSFELFIAICFWDREIKAKYTYLILFIYLNFLNYLCKKQVGQMDPSRYSLKLGNVVANYGKKNRI